MRTRALPAPRRALGLLGVLAAVACLLAAPAGAAPVPAGYTYSHAWFTAKDGIQLHAGVFLPTNRAADEKHPVILVSTPYASPNGGATAVGNLTGPTVRFPELFTHDAFKAGRYAYIEVDVRGFGGSGGCFGYYLEPEKQDAGVAVTWAASQPWSTGRVGMWGKSYDAAQQVLAMAADPAGLAATVIQEPGLSAYTALWMNGVHYATGRYATTGVYTADDVGPAQNQSTATDQNYAMATVSGATANPTCRTDALVNMNAIGNRNDPFWAGKEPFKLAAGSDVPTFWQHGFWDANTKPAHLEVWNTLTGPRQAWFGQFTHLRGHESGVGRSGFLDEALRFLDRHVRQIDVPATDPTVTVQSGNGEGQWRSEAAWPPADGVAWSLPLLPGTYTDEPGGEAGGSAAGKAVWSISPVLPHTVHLAGETLLRAKITALVPGVHVVAHLYDIDDAGRATLVTRGAAATTGTGAQDVAYALYPQDWLFEEGHRIGIHLSAADDTWFSPGVTNTDVQVTGGDVTLPLLRYTRTFDLDGGVSDGMNDNAPFTVPAATLTGRISGEVPPAQEQRQ